MKVYSTDCPKCNILKTQLKSAGIEFEVSKDLSILFEKGFSSVPVLELEDGTLLGFDEAIKFLISRKG